MKSNIHLAGLLVSGALLAPAASVHAASFDCGKASVHVEHLVCANAELSALDEDLAWFHAHIVRIAMPANKRAQQLWLSHRNRCTDVACLRSTYIERISQLAKSKDVLIRPGPGDPDGEARLTLKNGWISGKNVWGEPIKQDSDKLCRAAAAHMNRYAADWRRHHVVLFDNLCVTASLSIPGMTQPPWQELKPGEHRLLIAKLLRLRSEGPQEYFAASPRADRRSDDFYLDAAAKFVAEGGVLLKWTTKLFSAVKDARTNEMIDTAQQQQTIVELRQPAREWQQSVASATCQPSAWSDYAFLVEADLSGPLPVNIRSLDNASVALYQGAPVFLRDYTRQLLIDDTSAVYGGTRCNLSAVTK